MNITFLTFVIKLGISVEMSSRSDSNARLIDTRPREIHVVLGLCFPGSLATG